MSKAPEAAYKTALRKDIIKLGLVCESTTDAWSAGKPDLYIETHRVNGFVEVKMLKNKTKPFVPLELCTELQQLNLAKKAEHEIPCAVLVVSSFDRVRVAELFAPSILLDWSKPYTRDQLSTTRTAMAHHIKRWLETHRRKYP